MMVLQLPCHPLFIVHAQHLSHRRECHVVVGDISIVHKLHLVRFRPRCKCGGVEQARQKYDVALIYGGNIEVGVWGLDLHLCSSFLKGFSGSAGCSLAVGDNTVSAWLPYHREYAQRVLSIRQGLARCICQSDPPRNAA